MDAALCEVSSTGRMVVSLLAVMLVMDFLVTGTSLSPIIQDYRLAAQARTGTYSVLDALGYIFEWTVFGVVVLLALYAVAQAGRQRNENLWRCVLTILFFWVCQVVLNMSNYAGGATIFLAPAAVVVVVTWTGTPDAIPFGRIFGADFIRANCMKFLQQKQFLC